LEKHRPLLLQLPLLSASALVSWKLQQVQQHQQLLQLLLQLSSQGKLAVTCRGWEL
jgi:hypothetical protein